MRWGEIFAFTRPVRSLLVLFGEKPLDIAVGHLQSRATTAGHRFMGKPMIDLTDEKSY
jgi:glycyl-tRNA synthetase beta subunit